MSKSLIYMANTSSQSLVDGGVVNFGFIRSRYGCNCQSNGSTVQVRGTGYYSIDTNLTIVAGAAGVVTVTLYKDGVTIPGAVASNIVSNGGTVSISIPAVVREKCCDTTSLITAVVSGIATTVTNASIEVIKE